MALPEDSIKCVFITPEFFDAVVEFAANHFTLVNISIFKCLDQLIYPFLSLHQDLPILQSIGLTDSPLLRAYFRHSIEQGTSVMAIDTSNNNKIVGVRAHRRTKPSEKDEIPVEYLNDPLMTFVQFIATCEEQYDPHTELKVPEYLHMKYLCVDRNYRGRNISVKMMDFTFDFMRKEQIPVAYVVASSAYSLQVFLKCDFEVVHQIQYEDYKVDGEVVFKTGPVHTKCALLIKWIK